MESGNVYSYKREIDDEILKSSNRIFPTPNKLDLGSQIEIETNIVDFLNQTYDAERMIIGYPFHWVFAQPTRGGVINYEYTEYQGGKTFFSNVSAIKNRGHRLWLHIKTSPSWARIRSDSVCGMLRPDAYIEYAEMCKKLVGKFRPEAIVIWNEPTVPMSTDQISGLYNGCWGNSVETGSAYASLVKVVYTEVKRNFPRVRIVVGEHIHRGAAFPFWETAVANGIQDYCDMVSFHSYVWDGGDYHKVIDDAIFWSEKTKKPLVITETALMTEQHSAEFEAHKLEFLAYILTNLPKKAPRVTTLIWYPMCCHNWRNTSLLSPIDQDRSAYNYFNSYIRVLL